MFKEIDGGVCAALGFKASGIHCGIRKNHSKRDLALISSDRPAQAAAVYTQNLVKGAPLTVTAKHIANGCARAIICNSGNANTCNANGIEIAQQTSALLGNELGIDADDIIVASTGVIGQKLDISPIAAGIPQLVASLAEDGSAIAADAIMTTDTVKKEVAIEFDIDGTTCHMGGIAKGSGMIHPNMATMLVFITTDAAINHELLQAALSADVQDSFNMISVDGDTSTNDMVVLLANGAAENVPITAETNGFETFRRALAAVTSTLCRAIAQDGEGASKMLECAVSGAPNKEAARTIAKSIICSSLVKAAMFGADANWGRVLCAIGYSGANVRIDTIDVAFQSLAGTVDVCRAGAGIDFSEELASKILAEAQINILVNLNQGVDKATAWGCDLTYEYVKINGDYRT